MSINSDNRLGEMLADGWQIVGHSVCMMAAGALSHHILLQKQADVTSLTRVTMGAKEVGRTWNVFAPVITLEKVVPEKRGFFG